MSDTALSPAMAALRRALDVRDPDSSARRSDDTTRLACWMLTAIRPWPDAAGAVLQGLFTAHREGQADGAVWRRLRRDAVTLGDDADALIRAYGQVAEAAAWPLATTQAGLVEMMQAICQLRAKQATAVTGWTEKDEQDAHRVLGAIARGDGTTRPAREEIPALFMSQDPVLERRFSIGLMAANAAFSGFRAEVAAWIDGATG